MQIETLLFIIAMSYSTPTYRQNKKQSERLRNSDWFGIGCLYFFAKKSSLQDKKDKRK